MHHPSSGPIDVPSPVSPHCSPVITQEGISGSSARLATAERRALQPRAIALGIDLLLVVLPQTWIGFTFGAHQSIYLGLLSPAGGPSVTVPSYILVGFPWWDIAVATGYFALFEVLFGRTPGKVLTGIAVVAADGTRPTWQALLVRNLLRPIDALPTMYMVGGVMALAGRNHQRFGDLAAGTRVVMTNDVGLPSLPKLKNVARRVIVLAVVAALVAGSLAFEYWGRLPLDLQQALTSHGASSAFPVGESQFSNLVLHGSTATADVRGVDTAGRAWHGTITLSYAGLGVGWLEQGAEWTCDGGAQRC